MGAKRPSRETRAQQSGPFTIHQSAERLLAPHPAHPAEWNSPENLGAAKGSAPCVTLRGGMVFSSWYQGYYPKLLATLTVVATDPELAADATAEAFTRALEKWDTVSTMTSPEGWTYRVGLNVVRRRMRRASLERRLLRRPEPTMPVELDPEVWQAVKELSSRQREAIALRYLVGMSEAEVADALGVAIGTASATLSTARSRLASLLSHLNTPDHEPSEVDR